ncbi:MAG: transporter substrate-binding domain-containing protein [Candidatus Thermoplasmatota archaeon]|nr:transporter substrate-binding domain-containing protein [Candidatus Thermoplasmatota archaeon]
MKKCLILIVCLTLFIGIFVSADDPSISLKIGIYENEPLIFTDENGTVKGIYADIVEYIASEEGWKIEYIHGTWDECLNRLKNNSIDILTDIAYTEERSKIYDYTNETVLANWSQLYIQKGSKIQTFLDLEDKRIAVVTSDVYNVGPQGIRKLMEKFDINCTFVEVKEYADALECIENKSVDAGVVNRLFGMKFESKYEIDRSPILFSPIELHFAFPKNASMNPYLIEKMDCHVIELKKDKNSIYYRSIEKYLGAGVTEEIVEIVPEWIKNVLMVSSGVLILFLIMNMLSKAEIKRKTIELRESQEKLERLFMDNPEAAVHLDSDSHILNINSRFAKLFGYSLDEIKSKCINDVIVPEDKMKEAKMLDKKVGEGYIYHDTVRNRNSAFLTHR